MSQCRSSWGEYLVCVLSVCLSSKSLCSCLGFIILMSCGLRISPSLQLSHKPALMHKFTWFMLPYHLQIGFCSNWQQLIITRSVAVLPLQLRGCRRWIAAPRAAADHHRTALVVPAGLVSWPRHFSPVSYRILCCVHIAGHISAAKLGVHEKSTKYCAFS